MSDDPRMGEPGTARHALWWALWDDYTDTIKASLIDDYAHELLTAHQAAVKEEGPVECPCCGREAHYCE